MMLIGSDLEGEDPDDYEVEEPPQQRAGEDGETRPRGPAGRV